MFANSISFIIAQFKTIIFYPVPLYYIPFIIQVVCNISFYFFPRETLFLLCNNLNEIKKEDTDVNGSSEDEPNSTSETTSTDGSTSTDETNSTDKTNSTDETNSTDDSTSTDETSDTSSSPDERMINIRGSDLATINKAYWCNQCGYKLNSYILEEWIDYKTICPMCKKNVINVSNEYTLPKVAESKISDNYIKEELEELPGKEEQENLQEDLQEQEEQEELEKLQ